MTKKRSTKRALLLSFLSLLMCVSMLIGSTYAWFTDSVTSANNIIKSGTLDVEMYWAKGNEDPSAAATKWTDASAGAIFNSELWEPGYVEVRHIKIENKGSLAFKYQLNIAANGVVSELANVIDVYYVDPAVQVKERTELTDAYKLGTLAEVLNGIDTTGTGVLVPENKAGNGFKSSETLTIALKMRETAGNEYQGKSIGSDFTVQLLATQLTYEEDSFDDQYDKDAVYGDVMVSTDAELKAAIEDPEIKVIAVNGDLTYDWGGNSYANSNALYMKGKTFFGANDAAAITFAGYGSANPIVSTTFRNITVKDVTVGDSEGSWEHGHLEFENLTASNVTFANTIMLSGVNTLTNCVMENTVSSWYGIWVAGGNTVIKDSSFSGTRSVKIHEAYGTDVESVVIDNCEFGALSEKPGVVIGDLDATTKVTIKNSTFANCQAGDQGLYIYETDTDVTTIDFTEKNNTVQNTIVVSDIAELTAALANGGHIVLQNDIVIPAGNFTQGDPTVVSIPVGLLINSGKDTTIDFNGKTISAEETGTETALIHILDTNVTIKGNSNFVQNGTDDYLIWAKGNSTVTIEAGSFATNGADNVMLYASDANGIKATIAINGGEFTSNGATAQNHINIRNHGLGKVVISGGTFNFNPDWSVYTDVHARDDAAHIVIADGYHSVDNGNGTWSVVAD